MGRQPKKTKEERMHDADVRCSQWLADGNEYREAGDHEKAQLCYDRCQFWKDRYNLLAGNR